MADPETKLTKVTTRQDGTIKLMGGHPAPLYLRAMAYACDPQAGLGITEVQPIVGPGSDYQVGVATDGSNGCQSCGNAPPRQVGPTGVEAVVGYADSGSFTPFHAFRWTEEGGFVDLGTLDPPNNSTKGSQAAAVSHDGSIVVGNSDIAGAGANTTRHAFRWTATGMVDLGAPAGPTRNSSALDVSGDGAVIVGEADFIDAAQFTGIRSGAFRWTAAGGFVSLGAIEPGYFTRANATSADGSVVVGEGGIEIRVGNTSTNGSRAFRWTQGGGLVVLGPLSGHRFAAATDVSGDGAVVVGTSSSEVTGSVAFRWTAATGMQDLRQLLVAAGVDLTGVQLLSAISVSGDGQWILGEMRLASEEFPISFLARFCDAAVTGPCEPIPPASPNFSVSVPGATELTIAAGSSTTTTVTVTPQNGFTQAVTFACAGLPAGAECRFSPSTITPTTAPVTTTLTLMTTGSAGVPGPFADRVPSLPLSAPLWIGALAAFTLLASQTRSARRLVPRLCAVIAVATVGACGDSGPAGLSPTPAGTYEVTVTATSGSGASALEKTTALTLTVTP